jgi:hypothetical protein
MTLFDFWVASSGVFVLLNILLNYLESGFIPLTHLGLDIAVGCVPGLNIIQAYGWIQVLRGKLQTLDDIIDANNAANEE